MEPGNRLGATLHKGHRFRIDEATADIVENAVRRLVARVVIGNHNPIGQPLGDLGHEWALAGVTVTTAAEQAEQATTCVRT